MTAPTGMSNRKIALILTAVTIVSSAAVMGSAYLVHKTTGMLYDVAVAIALAVVAGGGWLFTRQVVFRRIDRHYDRLLQEKRQAVEIIAGYRADALRLYAEATEARRSGDYAVLSVARGRLIAALVRWRAALPDDWPVATQVDEMLAQLWPNIDELPADSPPDAIVAHFVRRKDNFAQVQQATEAINFALIVLGDAGQRVAEATYDRELSLQGGFDDPDKAGEVAAARAAFDQAVADVRFVMIAKADEVADTNPKLAATLADLHDKVADAASNRGQR